MDILFNSTQLNSTQLNSTQLNSTQLNFNEGNTLTLDGKAYSLKQFHFHAPSENHINGKSYPFEAHLVHADDKGNLAVLGVMFEEGEKNEVLDIAWTAMPSKAGDKNTLSGKVVSVANMLPDDKDYYRFNGSLTIPPCSEGVTWLALKTPVTLSKEQIAAFTAVIHQPNNRPLQPLNARVLLH